MAQDQSVDPVADDEAAPTVLPAPRTPSPTMPRL